MGVVLWVSPQHWAVLCCSKTITKKASDSRLTPNNGGSPAPSPASSHLLHPAHPGGKGGCYNPCKVPSPMKRQQQHLCMPAA